MVPILRCPYALTCCVSRNPERPCHVCLGVKKVIYAALIGNSLIIEKTIDYLEDRIKQSYPNVQRVFTEVESGHSVRR
jgi:hypothetical protein